MLDIKKLQKEVFQNKVNKWFNTTNVTEEISNIHAEVSELYDAWRKKLPDLGEEMADVVIFVLWLAEMLDIDVEDELKKKIKKNKNRVYKNIDWVLTRMTD